MGKPSIFSRQYEKKMKRRKRNIIVVSLSIILVISVLIIKVVCNPIDYNNLKGNMQAWIDSDTDTDNISEQTEKTKEEIPNNKETVDEKSIKEDQKEPSEESIDITLFSGSIAKAIYVDDNKGGKVFKTLNTTDGGVSYNINPSGKQMVVTDTNLIITLYNVDGTTKIISKEQYISSSGGVFTKEATMKETPKYLWNVTPKFISEEKIIFVTNRPYFGNATLKQYLWLTDIQTGVDKVLWDLAGANINIGEREEKGLKLTIDGKVYYMDVNGNYVQ